MLSRKLIKQQPGRKHITRAAAVALLILTFGVAGSVLAVHDEAMQLDGDVSASTTTTIGGNTQAVDWDSLFDANGDDKTLPTGFQAADFQADFTSGSTADASTYATGSKDILPISGWQCNRDNNVNNKIDINNAYSAAYKNAAGDDILYFALERSYNGGDANVGFWFLQDAVGCSSPGGAVTFSGAHQDGDLLIVSAFTKGGVVSTIDVYRWTGGANGSLNPTPVAHGVDCKATGGADTACATVNTGTISTPWLTNSVKLGTGHSLPVASFFEGGLNLTKANLSGKCFNSFLGDTRSSQSLTATLFDFAGGTLGECTADVTTTPKQGDGSAIPAGGLNIPVDPADASLSVKDSAVLNVTGVPSFTGSISFHLCGPTAADATTLCDSGGVDIGSVTANSNGTYSSAAATVTSAGRYCWRADFSSTTTGVPTDSDSSANECFIVNPAQPSLTTDATDGPVNFGSPISDVVSLSGTAHKPGSGGPTGSNGTINPTTLGGDATGDITVRAFGPDSCSTVAFTSTAIAASGDGTSYGGAGSAFEFTPTAPGQYIFVASYAGDSPNTLAIAESGCAGAPEAEKVTVRQIPTSVSSDPWAYPNDTATIGSTIGNLAAGGTVQFRLFNSLANCTAGAAQQTVGSGGLIYKQSFTPVGGAATETFSTTNTSVSVSTNSTVYWRVTYTPAAGDTAHTGRQSACVENIGFTFTGDAGPGTLFP